MPARRPSAGEPDAKIQYVKNPLLGWIFQIRFNIPALLVFFVVGFSVCVCVDCFLLKKGQSFCDGMIKLIFEIVSLRSTIFE